MINQFKDIVASSWLKIGDRSLDSAIKIVKRKFRYSHDNCFDLKIGKVEMDNNESW